MKNSLKQGKYNFPHHKINPVVSFETDLHPNDLLKKGKKNYSDNIDPFIVDWEIPKTRNSSN